MEHTKEPWWVQEGFGNVYAMTHGDSGLTIHIATPNPNQVEGGSVEAEANARRIVACVNALAGIKNPEEWVKKAKEALYGRD